MKGKFITLALLALSTLNPQLSTVHAQGAAFTYQGRFNDGGQPANGTNYGMVFYLYDAPTGGTVLGNLGIASVTISNGLFTAPLDFGNQFDGNPRWLEITVQKNGGGFTTLTPRQQLTPTPYAIYAPNAGNAASAGSVAGTNIIGSIPLAQLPASVALRSGGNTFTGNQIVTNGSVGIGTATPTRIFQVRSGTDRVLSLFEGGQVSGVGIESVNDAGSANQLLEIRASPTVFTTGNVGIGTVNPTSALQVNGTVSASLFSGDGQLLANVNANNLASGTVNDLRLSTNVALRNGGNTFNGNQIFTNGSVGIGLATPSRIFQIRSGPNRVLSLFEGGQASGVGIESVNDANSANQLLEIRASPTVFTTGNVGIGTINPTTALQVNGTVTASMFSGNGAGLNNLSASAITGGLTTNILIGGNTFFITNGIIMNIQ